MAIKKRGKISKVMDKKKLLEKIYFKLVGLDFDQLSFHNHILVDEIISELKKLKDEMDNGDLPPPLPEISLADNVLQFQIPKELFKLRLMVLDEDVDILKLLEYSLKNEPLIELICEKSPRQALEKIKTTRPDILLMDIGIKEITAYEFLNEVKKIDPTRNIDIIVGAQNPNQHEKNSFLEMGAFDYITKPYDLTEVRFKLKLRLEKKRLCK